MTSTKAQTHPAETTVEFETSGRQDARRVQIRCAGGTHPGKVRSNNEDQHLIARLAKSMHVCQSSLPDDGLTRFAGEEGYLLVVADGMGGAAAGERASALAVESIEGFVLNTFRWFLHLGPNEEDALYDELREGLERADRAVFNEAQEDLRYHGMGTTLTMAYTVASDLFVVHAGDSRAYLFRDGRLHQLTNDHTFVQALVQGGAISSEAARKHKMRNIVTNVIGGASEGVHAEIHKLLVQDGDVLLLCSDGLTEPVPESEITEILATHPEPEKACQRLINRALDHGGPDNVTVIVAHYRMGNDE
jgi:protein phosphatase